MGDTAGDGRREPCPDGEGVGPAVEIYRRAVRAAGYEKELVAVGIAVDVEALRASWEEKVGRSFAEAQLAWPGADAGVDERYCRRGGKERMDANRW